MELNKDEIRYILQFFSEKSENARRGAEIVNGVYGADTVTANYVQFWFRRFRSGIFYVKDAPRTGRPVVENVDKIAEIIEVDRLVNARPHTCIVTLQKLGELGWAVLMHPLYSLNLAPSDYHLFLVLQNFLSEKKLGSREDCENRLLEFFTNKDQDFYERGIIKLPLKWQQIIQENGAY
ncbi:histone-lysine N-methyltransferase SETMAR [Trichonephila clavipes]|nr:histone-lysine N-methyltransferase SETMAR [Trichonephila clavipes]